MTLRYMTGESREEEERHNCPRCDNYRGYVCAEHREPTYEQLQAKLAEVEVLLSEIEIAEAIHGLPGLLGGVVRRLAFQRDEIQRQLAAAEHELAELSDTSDLAALYLRTLDTVYDLRQLLETAVDAWESVLTKEHDRDYWRMPLLNRDWYDAARKLTTTED